MGVIGAMAEFERDLLIERTQAGLQRAKAEGVALGRPASLDADQREAVQAELAGGASVSEVARRYCNQPPDRDACRGRRSACRKAARSHDQGRLSTLSPLLRKASDCRQLNKSGQYLPTDIKRDGDLPLSEIIVHGPPLRSLATEPETDPGHMAVRSQLRRRSS